MKLYRMEMTAAQAKQLAQRALEIRDPRYVLADDCVNAFGLLAGEWTAKNLESAMKLQVAPDFRKTTAV